MGDVHGADVGGFLAYAGFMRYAQGGGLTAEGRRRREQVRLEAAKRFEQRVPTAVIAAELRVSERSVRRWRLAWQAGGEAGLASRGQAAQCRLDERQLAALDVALEAGPLAAGWEDQRWMLARVRDLVGRQVQGAVHHLGDLVPAATARLDLPAGRAPGDRARRRRGGGVEEGDLAADKSTAAALGGWIVFEDECGQSMRPPRSRTWGRRGITPVIRVRGGGTGRVSVAGLACYRPGDRAAADLPAALLPRPQGRDEGLHLDRVPGPADRRAPAAARRGRRAGVGQPQRPPGPRAARLHRRPGLAAGVPAARLCA